MNGFGRYEFIHTDEELFKLFAFDLNLDGNIDIGGLDKTGKNLFIFFGKGLNQFERPVKYSLSDSFSGLTVRRLNLDDRPNLILWSRITGKIEIFSVLGKSLLRIKSIKIDCCFFEVVPVNLDHTRELELIVYGSNYNGIDVISLRAVPIRITRISDGFYDILVPFYLNSDEKIDFVTFNNVNKELYLFRNNSNLNFSKALYRKFNSTYGKLHVGNYDEDGINDLAMVSNRSYEVNILSGNGIGGFDRINSIQRKSIVTTSISYDYNRDLEDDFIFYSTQNNLLTLDVIKDGITFLSLPLIEIDRINSITNYLTTTTKGVLFSTTTGLNLIYYSSLPDFEQTYAISAGIVNLQFLSKHNEVFNKILWIDKRNRTLNLLLRTEFNTPKEIYFINLSSDYDLLEILDDDKRYVKLVCFSIGKYYFDYFIIDLLEKTFKRKVVTVDGEIFQIGLNTPKGELLTVVVKKSDALKVFVVNPFAVNQVLLSKQLNREKVLAFTFDFTERKFIGLISEKDLRFNLIVREFESNFEKFSEYSLGKFNFPKAIDYNLYLCGNKTGESIIFLNLIALDESKLFVLRPGLVSNAIELQNINLPDRSFCNCVENSITKEPELLFLNEKTNELERLALTKRSRLLRQTVLENLKNISSVYAISSLPSGELAYVYNYSILRIKKLKK